MERVLTMHSACLPDGKVITATSYDECLHGSLLSCIDKSCGVPVIFVQGTKDIIPHFKTSGKGASVHHKTCGFFRKLTFEETVSKVSEYQNSLRAYGIREFVVRLNLNSIDPDYEIRTLERTPKEVEEKEKEELESDALKEETASPKSIGSLRSIKKLFSTVEPDLLASIIVTVKGIRVPISELIRFYEHAHKALWDDKTLDVSYFIHGTVEKVVRRDKVWFINFHTTDNCFFSLVIFDRHFKHFTLKDNELIGKSILAYGYLKKNTYTKDKQATEMVIKSNKYIEFL